MATAGHRVFLSYRREDSAGHAGRLADHLLDRFGQGSVFMDVESIEAGADFSAEIERAIAGTEAVLVLIGPGWLDAKTTSGIRRLDEPADFVRREVEAALASQVRVVPVLVGGASMPAESDLPTSIAAIAGRNAVELLDRRWREDVDALVDVLEGRGRGALGNLPLQPTPFLGRELELAELTELLRGAGTRLLTLTGPGGSGKTRLSLELAAEVSADYPDGVWFVPLGALTDPALVVPTIAQRLRVRETPNATFEQALAAYLRAKRTLLVLDNLEQLLPDAALPLGALLAETSRVVLLTSSRQPLHLGGEREYAVPPMSLQDAVDLFEERARAARADFVLNGTRGTVQSICARLDRLPLAVELAAARVQILSVEQLLARLDQRLPLLTGGAADAPERQRTLRAAIEWSHDLLDESERVLFARLAVFVGGATLDATERVGAADLDTLESLVDKSLVRADADVDGEPRFSMLETIRELAQERLAAQSDAGEVRRRHAEYFLDLAMDAEDELRGPEQRRWLHRLELEHDNFRAALTWSLGGSDPSLGLALAAAIAQFWYLHGDLSEGRRWLALALELGPSVATEARAKSLDWAGYFAAEQGDEAVGLLEESRRCARDAGALAIAALATSHLGVFIPPDRRDEMVPLGEESVALARGSGSRWILATALNNLGEAFREIGDGPRALAAHEEAYAIRLEMGDMSRVALSLSNLSEMAAAAGDFERARSLSTEALGYAETLGDRRHVSFASANLGWIELAEGRTRESIERFLQALRLDRDVGMSQAAVMVLHGIAGALGARGDPVRAAWFEAAAQRHEHELDERLGHIPSMADEGIHARYLAEARESLAPEAWDRARTEGTAVSLDDAIETALSIE